MWKHLVHTIVLVCASQLLAAQTHDFITYSVDDGLPQSQVTAIAQDAQGYLWIGTNGGGVARFDGISFHSYTTDQGLVNNRITDLLATDRGMLVATEAGISEWTLGPPGQDPAFKTLLSNGKVLMILETDNGVVFGSDKGYGMLGGAVEGTGQYVGILKGSFYTAAGKDLFNTSGDIVATTNSRIVSLSADSTGLVVGMVEGAAMFNGKELTPVRGSDVLFSRQVNQVLTDSKGRKWYATGGGLVQYDNGWSTFGELHGLSTEVINCLFEDREGNLWIGTDGGGLVKYRQNRFIRYPIEKDRDVNQVESMAMDRDGNIWIGTYSGLYYFDGKRMNPFIVSNPFKQFHINAVATDGSNNIWYAIKEYGVFRVQGGSIDQTDSRQGLIGDNVQAIMQDTKGALWFGTDVGLSKFDGSFHNYTTEDGLSDNTITCIATDAKGNTWVGTTNGITIFDVQNVGVTPSPIQTIGVEDGLPDGRINALVPDRGGMWAATDNGLIHLSQQNTVLSTLNGLSSNLVYSLVVVDGILWAGNNKGVDRIEVTNMGATPVANVTALQRSEGFTGGETRRNAALVDDNGDLWFGTLRGVLRYSPGLGEPNLVPPMLHLTNFQADQEPFPFWGTETMPNVSHNVNYISFDFIGISLAAPQKVEYQFMLEGFDEDWLPPTERTNVTYSSLPTGKEYVFKVRAQNGSGVWSEQEVRFPFFLVKPWWQETWFILLSVVLVLGAGFWVFYSIFDRKVKRKALEERIANLQLNALRAQMNPHFIFNALNSIQNFINKSDEESANIYLAKFAALMRLILDNTKQSRIPLADELKLLDLYLSLEKLRFKEQFDYSIVTDTAIAADVVRIPSMLIQPYVENAVNHGLMHKEGQGMVEVRLTRAPGAIKCSVEDNGIGRDKAMELKAAKPAKPAHQSAGISITKDRLDILNLTPKGSMSVDIIDLFDKSNEPRGTRVVINIPVED